MHSHKKAIVVVHGIGEQVQGDTLERLATSYVVTLKQRAARRNTHIRKSTLQLHSRFSANGDQRRIDTFKADVLTADDLPDVIFAEVYWADISRILTTSLGFLIGIVRTLTGIRFIVEAAGDSLIHESDGWSARFVRQIGRYINRMLVGPLVALNAALFFVVLVSLWFDSIFWGHVTFGYLSALFLLSIHLLAKAKYLLEETKWDAMAAYLLFAAFLLLGSSFEAIGGYGYLDNVEWISDVFWSLLSVGLLVLVVASAVVFLFHKDARPSLTIACAGPCLNVLLWALALSNFWLVGVGDLLPAIDASYGGDGLLFRLFPMLLFLWFAALSVGLTLCGVFYYRSKIAAENREPPEEIWRLILSPWAVWSLVVFVAGWFSNTTIAWAVWFSPVHEIYSSPIHTIHNWTKDNLWLVSLFVVGSQGLVIGFISQALGLLLDITTYFRREDPIALVHSFGESETDDVELAQTKTAFVQREKIADRFRCLVSHMVCEEDVSELTILAHSQGTVTAIQQLQTIEDWLGTKIPSIRLITMGSPYTHIYQYYFPDKFKAPSLEHVAEWINIYTINDYVGTWIDDKAAIGTVPKNIAREQVATEWKPDDVRPIGHSGYWADEVVMQIIKDKAPF